MPATSWAAGTWTNSSSKLRSCCPPTVPSRSRSRSTTSTARDDGRSRCTRVRMPSQVTPAGPTSRGPATPGEPSCPPRRHRPRFLTTRATRPSGRRPAPSRLTSRACTPTWTRSGCATAGCSRECARCGCAARTCSPKSGCPNARRARPPGSGCTRRCSTPLSRRPPWPR